MQDAYGRPIHPSAYGYVYGDGSPVPPQFQQNVQGYPAAPPQIPHGASAVVQPDNIASLRQGGVYRTAFFPTSPRHFVEAGEMTRDYSTGLLSTDTDYAVGTEVIRIIRFDLPCVIVAINGAAFPVQEGNAFPVGIGPRDCWLFRLEYTTGERLNILQRIASTVVGSAERPGEIGGSGWNIDQSGAVQIGITPLMADLRIDITLVCLEQRGRANFTPQPR